MATKMSALDDTLYRALYDMLPKNKKKELTLTLNEMVRKDETREDIIISMLSVAYDYFAFGK